MSCLDSRGDERRVLDAAPLPPAMLPSPPQGLRGCRDGDGGRVRGRGWRKGAGMEMGDGRRGAGGGQGAARRERELPGAEEWLRAEEGALELNFLSPRWGWDLCCHLQGDAGCAAAGILMAVGGVRRGAPGAPPPPLGQAAGSGAAPASPAAAVSLLGGYEPPQDLLLGGRRVWRDGGASRRAFGTVSVTPLPRCLWPGDRAAPLLAASGAPHYCDTGAAGFWGDPRVSVAVACRHPPLPASPRASRDAGWNRGAEPCTGARSDG